VVLDGRFTVSCRLANCRLMPGSYVLTLILKSGGTLVDQVEGIPFEITPRDVYGTGRVLPERTGTYVPEAAWEVRTP